MDTKSQFITLVRSSINSDFKTPDFELDYEGVFALAKKHFVVPTIYDILMKCPNMPSLIKDKINKIYFTHVTQQAKQESIQAEIQKVFVENKVHFLFLKGEGMRKLYPNPLMRFSSDIDIFFKLKELKIVQACLEGLGFRHKGDFNTEIVYLIPPFVSVEMHYALDSYKTKDYYANFFDRLIKVDDYMFKMTDEDFYIHNVLHILKHFETAGTGVRSIIDIYLINKKLNLDLEYVEKQFELLGINTFHKELKNLAFSWFDNLDKPICDTDLASFILESGVYGNPKHRIENELNASKTKLGFYLKWIFPPYGQMVMRYPFIRKFPPILPFMWLWRIFKKAFLKNDRLKTSIKLAKKTKPDSLNEKKELFKRLGLG